MVEYESQRPAGPSTEIDADAIMGSRAQEKGS